MSSQDDLDQHEREYRKLARLLEAAGRRPQPTQEQLARWRGHFFSELNASRRHRRVRRASLIAGLAAAVLLTIGLLWPTGPTVVPVRVGEVASVVGGVVSRGPDGKIHRLAAGDGLAEGQRVEAGMRSGVALLYRGVDVRLDASTKIVLGSALTLLTGRVYVDTGPDSERSREPRIVVDTPAGRFSDIGTQFVVDVSGGEVLGAVREGGIRLHGRDVEMRVDASPGSAGMVVVSEQSGVQRLEAPPRGPLWTWAESVSPGIVLAGRRADEVLKWVARERGQELHYTSADAAAAASGAQLAGSGTALAADGALRVLSVATSLRVTSGSGNRLEVALASEADQQTQ